VSCSTVFAVFVCGSFSISSNLIRKLLDYGISIYFTTKYNFRVYAEIGAKAEGNYWLREKQYSFKDEIGFSKNLLYNKIYNQFGLIKELKPDYFKKVSKAVLLKKTLEKIEKCQNIDELMGIEGSISKDYFKVLFEDNNWYKRLPRTKVDVNNFLLDMGYTFLFNFVDSLLRLHGVDSYKGIYHQLFFQRKSLVCDLVEPFRCLIDKAIIKAYHLKQIKSSDFTVRKGVYYLRPDCQKKYLYFLSMALMDRKEDLFKYVKAFYFYMLNDEKDYPFFKYKK
jgi:CRISPR-associated protein Cas1